MKIGIDIRLIGKKQTGSEAVFFNLVKNLALLDNRNNYQLFTDIQDIKILREIKNALGIENKNNFEIISLETRNKFNWNFWTLPKYLRANPSDLYLTQYITPFFVSKKIKIFTIIHDISFRVSPKFIKGGDLFFLRMLVPLALRRADKVIAVSQFTRDEIISYYNISPKKIEYIHNAVADDFLGQAFSPSELEIVRQKYNLPQKFILYLGTLQPRKNLPVLIEAYAKIKNQAQVAETKIKLVVAGGKGHNYDRQIDEALKKYSLGADEVVFPGFILEEDKKAVMFLADCFCTPSSYEGFGIPILEAFSAELPCVVSDILPHKEVAGDAVLFFASKNFTDLSQKLLAVLTKTSLSDELIAKGKKRLELFSWKETAKNVLQIFEGLGK